MRGVPERARSERARRVQHRGRGEEDRGGATPRRPAIASRRAGELYGLEALADRIQTYPDNSTRFGALARDPAPLREPDKSSLVFGVGHVAGSLYRCLGALAERHLNLTKLESRPRPGRPWEYVFYADVEASARLPAMVDALEALSEHATFTRLLGTYARASATSPNWVTRPSSSSTRRELANVNTEDDLRLIEVL